MQLVKKPIIMHIPHSSTYLPEDIRKDILLTDPELKKELIKMTDHYTDELAFIGESIYYFKHKYSRLFFDPERFRDDEQEVMSKVGMGVIYTKTSDGNLLRDINDQQKANILMDYDLYHHEFNNLIEEILQAHDKCFIIDIHSYPALPLPYELNRNSPRPDFCIGSDSFHTPKELMNFSIDYLSDKGFSIDINTPFSGAFVPSDYYSKDERVISIMIEIKRSLYMDEASGEKLATFDSIKKVLQSYLISLVDKMHSYLKYELS